MHLPITKEEAESAAKLAVRRMEELSDAEWQVEDFFTKLMASWPKADALEKPWLQDTEDIKEIHMFFLGMEHGIKTVARRGGLARTKSMSPKRRSQSARKAARARWAKA